VPEVLSVIAAYKQSWAIYRTMTMQAFPAIVKAHPRDVRACNVKLAFLKT